MLRLTTLVLLTLMAQQPPPNTALIVGRVLDQTDGKPLGGAAVELVRETEAGFVAETPRRQLTDGLGRFVFRELPAGVYQLRAEFGGTGFSPAGFIQNGFGFRIGTYLNGGFGQARPGGPIQPLTLAQGQAVIDVAIHLWRGAVISGTVLDDTGEPVVDTVVGAVQVSSEGTLLTGPTVRTDDRGAYRISALLPGKYIVFVPQTTTAMSAESADAALQRLTELSASQKPGTAVPLYPELTGIRVGNSIVNTTSTGLIDGNIMPRRNGDAVFVFQTTFHPSAATLSSAATVDVAAGDDRSGIDVMLQPVRAVPVSGTVLAGGAPAAGVRLRLVPGTPASDAAYFETAVSRTDAQGRFTFPLVPVGNYTLVALNKPQAARPVASANASAPGPGDVPGAWLSEPVGVGPDGVSGLAFTMKSGFSVRGQFEFVGATPPPAPRDFGLLTFMLRSVRPRARADLAGGGAEAAANPAGTFAAVGVPPGRYVFGLYQAPSRFPWRIQSITVGGREVNDMPVDIADDLSDVHIVFSDKAAAVTGRVTLADPGDAAVAVVLFPSDRSLWPDARAMSKRFRLTRAGVSSEFLISDVPAGDYFAVALPDAAAASWPDVALLAKLLVVATPVRVVAGQSAALTLTVKAIR